MTNHIPNNLRRAIQSVASEYMKSFNEDEPVPLPQAVAQETVRAIKTAASVRSVK